MNAVIGEILPSALGIALSPAAVIAVIVALASPRIKGSLAGFVVGWAVGIALAVVVLTLLASIIPAGDPRLAGLIGGIVAIVLGAVLLLLAFGELRARPAGEQPRLPGWTHTVGDMTMVKAFVVGVLAVVANPKNLVLAIAGGLTIGVAALPIWPLVITVAIFVLVAVSTALIPIVAHLVAPHKTADVLDAAGVWLAAHSSAVFASAAFIVGITLVGQGIAAF